MRRMLDRHPEMKLWFENASAAREAAEEGKREEKAAEARAEGERKERDRVRYLTISFTPEAEAWRRENGVSDVEAIRANEKMWRDEREAERAERSQRMRDDFDRLERTLSRVSGTAFHLRAMLRPFVDQLPGEFVTALYFKMWDELTEGERRQALRRRDEEEHERRGLPQLGTPETGDDPDDTGLSCREEYLDYRDAAVDDGEWQEEADADER